VITSEIRKEVIKSADAIFFGSPTRFGIMTAQMKSFFDALGGLWYENACVGKVASCFTGSGTQHGGQETTIFSMITPLLHLGFMYVGLPYSCKELLAKDLDEISGGTPYGATYIAGNDGSRAVSNNEKACARYQGRHVAQIAKELKFGRERITGLPSGDKPRVVGEDKAVAPKEEPAKIAEKDGGSTSTNNIQTEDPKKEDPKDEKKPGDKKKPSKGESAEPKKKASKSDGSSKGDGKKKTEKKSTDKKKTGNDKKGGEKKKKTTKG